MTFSATDAAFEGFKVVRRHPFALVFWSLAYLAAFALFFLVFGGSLATIMATTAAMQTGGEPTMQDVEALGSSYLGMGAVTLPVSLLFSAVLYAAVARSVLRPAEKAFGYLRIGADELRVLAVMVVLTLVLVAVSVLAFGVVGVAAGFAGASGINALWLIVVLLGLAAFGLVIWLSLRLSLAVPITMAERRIALFDSFALTKGRSMALLGMAVVAFIMSMLVGLLGTIVVMPITLMTGGLESLAALEGQSTMEVLRAAGPAIATWVVLNAIISALQLAVQYAPFSAAYRDLKGLRIEG